MPQSCFNFMIGNVNRMPVFKKMAKMSVWEIVLVIAGNVIFFKNETLRQLKFLKSNILI